MRTRTRVSTVSAAVLGAAVFVVPPAVAGAGSANPTPMPSSSVPYPCKTSPAPSATPANTPPTAPGTPEIVRTTLNVVRLRWAPATDSDGIACYYVREDRGDGTFAVVASFQPAVTEGDVYLPWPPSGVPSQTHNLYVVAVDTKGAIGPASGTVAVTIYNDVITPSPSPSPSPSPVCQVKATSTSWDSGMTTNITITNTGSTTVRDWRLTFTFPNPGQQVTLGWSATWSQTGAAVTATAMSWNKDIAPGQTLWIGYNGTHTGANPTPAAFLLNGASCT
ncbi:cellulose binding domain-containing protein [Sphaerimonospora cavernae]|uniref:Cellulose binding domain-containing protein n=1 Tax=Sphaerimonospora cavernae TaxID=1740611 RepID=A0ABV6U5C2_9ACTN